MRVRNFARLLGIFSLPLFTACGNITVPASGSAGTGCGTGTAQIAVYDNLATILCGCTETAGTPNATASLTCTVAAGTVVYFQMINVRVRHQVRSTTTGGSTFTSSAICDPGFGSKTCTHAFTASTASSTWTFNDPFYPTLIGGQIVTL
jgi:hypothetical protein